MLLARKQITSKAIAASHRGELKIVFFRRWILQKNYTTGAGAIETSARTFYYFHSSDGIEIKEIQVSVSAAIRKRQTIPIYFYISDTKGRSQQTSPDRKAVTSW